jgi:hypothetical protein
VLTPCNTVRIRTTVVSADFSTSLPYLAVAVV